MKTPRRLSSKQTLLYLVLIAVLAGMNAACGASKAKYDNSPIGVTIRLFNSLEENDANKYLDSITPGDRQKPGYFFYRQLIQGISSSVGLGQVEASKIRISFSGLNLEEIDNTGTIAHVLVTGRMRDLNLALEEKITTTVTVVKIDEIWLVNASGDVIMPTPTPEVGSVGQRDVAPPATDEQIVAAEIFEQYAKNNGIKYRNTRYETISNDKTFSDVTIVAEAYSESHKLWLEARAVVSLRFIGGVWKSDVSKVHDVALTQNGQATVDAINAASVSARATASQATAVAFQSNVGGILAYVSNARDSIIIRKRDGIKTTIKPISDFPDTAGAKSTNYGNLAITPSEDGIYFVATVDDKVMIFYSDFESHNVRLLTKFSSQWNYIYDISVAPDGTKIAFGKGSFGSADPSIWVLPPEGGDGSKVFEAEGLSAAAWARDSRSIFVETKWVKDESPKIFNVTIDGNATSIVDLPSKYIEGDAAHVYSLLAISPNGKDLAIGGPGLALLRIENGDLTSVLENGIICKPKWSSDTRIVFATNSTLQVFNSDTGTFISGGYLNAGLDSGKCPYFDWIP